MSRDKHNPPREKRLVIGFYDTIDYSHPPALFMYETFADTEDGWRAAAIELAKFTDDLCCFDDVTTAVGIFEAPYRRRCHGTNTPARCNKRKPRPR